METEDEVATIPVEKTLLISIVSVPWHEGRALQMSHVGGGSGGGGFRVDTFLI